MPSYFSRGRHRKPTRTARQAAAITVAASTVGFAMTGQAHASDKWDALIQCESGGNSKAQNPSSSASGLFQFIDSTWKAFGGLEFAKRAKDATADEQYRVAERAFATEGYGPWAASKHCWNGKVDPKPEKKSDPKPVETTPQRAPEPAPEPEHQPAAPTAAAPTTPAAPELAPEPAPADGLSPGPEVDPVPVGPLQLGGGAVPAAHQYTVQPGDTLWGIAGPEWLATYEHNQALIGDNPDLIHPGQVLDI